jgi:hypothetical protein
MRLKILQTKFRQFFWRRLCSNQSCLNCQSVSLTYDWNQLEVNNFFCFKAVSVIFSFLAFCADFFGIFIPWYVFLLGKNVHLMTLLKLLRHRNQCSQQPLSKHNQSLMHLQPHVVGACKLSNIFICYMLHMHTAYNRYTFERCLLHTCVWVWDYWYKIISRFGEGGWQVRSMVELLLIDMIR